MLAVILVMERDLKDIMDKITSDLAMERMLSIGICGKCGEKRRLLSAVPLCPTCAFGEIKNKDK